MSTDGFEKMVREARRVEIRVSEYLPAEAGLLAIDAEKACIGFVMPDQRGLVTIVCRPEHETIARQLVDRLQAERAMEEITALLTRSNPTTPNNSALTAPWPWGAGS